MISSDRKEKARDEGYQAWKATDGAAHLTMNPYYRYTKQWECFNEGWNQARRESQSKDK